MEIIDVKQSAPRHPLGHDGLGSTKKGPVSSSNDVGVRVSAGVGDPFGQSGASSNLASTWPAPKFQPNENGATGLDHSMASGAPVSSSECVWVCVCVGGRVCVCVCVCGCVCCGCLFVCLCMCIDVCVYLHM